MRILVIAAIILVSLQSPVFAEEVAVSDQMANPRATATGKILGAQNYAIDTYGINLSLTDGVKPRDVYEVRRGNKKVAEAMVVFVSNGYSLLTVKKGSPLKKGDEVVFLRHAEVPREPVKLVPHEPVIVTERNVMSSRQIPSGGFHSSVSFSSGHSFSPTVGFSPSMNFQFQGMPGFSLPGFSAGGLSIGTGPSFSSPFGFSSPSFQTTVTSTPSFSFSGSR